MINIRRKETDFTVTTIFEFHNQTVILSAPTSKSRIYPYDSCFSCNGYPITEEKYKALLSNFNIALEQVASIGRSCDRKKAGWYAQR